MRHAASVLVLAPALSLTRQLVADLESIGTTVRKADTVAAAARSLSETPVDVVLCLTAGLDWRAALRAVHCIGESIPVVLLTRSTNGPASLEMLDAGAFDLLDRRYRVQELEWVVSNAAGHHSTLAAAGV